MYVFIYVYFIAYCVLVMKVMASQESWLLKGQGLGLLVISDRDWILTDMQNPDIGTCTGIRKVPNLHL